MIQSQQNKTQVSCAYFMDHTVSVKSISDFVMTEVFKMYPTQIALQVSIWMR